MILNLRVIPLGGIGNDVYQAPPNHGNPVSLRTCATRNSGRRHTAA